jgi:hypothetical protein
MLKPTEPSVKNLPEDFVPGMDKLGMDQHQPVFVGSEVLGFTPIWVEI